MSVTTVSAMTVVRCSPDRKRPDCDNGSFVQGKIRSFVVRVSAHVRDSYCAGYVVNAAVMVSCIHDLVIHYMNRAAVLHSICSMPDTNSHAHARKHSLSKG